MSEAIVLLSGGLDSSTVLAMAKERGFDVVAVTFDYGQKHRRELESAKKIAKIAGVKEHIVIALDLGRYLRSSLTQKEMKVPKGRKARDIRSDIPDTYVPSRNIVFLSIASSIAESRGAESIFIAANSVDFSGYPDCTPKFLASFQKVLDVGTKAGKEGHAVKVEAPLLRMSKGEIVKEALRLKVPLEHTWSCYAGGAKACGLCDSCQLRRRGFSEAGTRDPIEYEVK
jgi:7-cyano-7-deazaguanine synthase